MTPKTSDCNSLRQRACLLVFLATAVLLAPTSFAEEPDKTPQRKVPQRLPVVKSQPMGFASDPVRAVESDLIRCTAELAADQYAMEQEVTKQIDGKQVAPSRWLRSTTSSAASEVARRLIAQANREYSVGAWLSAENTAWSALRWAAEAVDLADREHGPIVDSNSPSNALESLQLARTAILESRDFSGVYGALDSESIARMARSHVSDFLDNESTEGLSAIDASDRYLDEARVALAMIATRSVEAAQTMDLLAAVYLSRGDAKTLPSATAICLRRAALQGQPDNASLASRLGMHLADVGLLEEARWALEHSLSLADNPQAADALVKVLRRTGQADEAAKWIARMQNQADRLAQSESSRPRIPEITQLSPAEFAAISKPVMPVTRTTSVSASLASAKLNVTGNGGGQNAMAADPGARPGAEAPSAPMQEVERPGMVRRLMSSFKRVW